MKLECLPNFIRRLIPFCPGTSMDRRHDCNGQVSTPKMPNVHWLSWPFPPTLTTLLKWRQIRISAVGCGVFRKLMERSFPDVLLLSNRFFFYRGGEEGGGVHFYRYLYVNRLQNKYASKQVALCTQNEACYISWKLLCTARFWERACQRSWDRGCPSNQCGSVHMWWSRQGFPR